MEHVYALGAFGSDFVEHVERLKALGTEIDDGG